MAAELRQQAEKGRVVVGRTVDETVEQLERGGRQQRSQAKSRRIRDLEGASRCDDHHGRRGHFLHDLSDILARSDVVDEQNHARRRARAEEMLVDRLHNELRLCLRGRTVAGAGLERDFEGGEPLSGGDARWRWRGQGQSCQHQASR